MAYSATSRIIHKRQRNVNPLVSFFWEYFGDFQGNSKGNVSKTGFPSDGKLLLALIGDVQMVVGQIRHAAAPRGTGQEA